MNDGGYGVIRNIQDAYYGGRRYYSDLHTPDFSALAAALGLPHYRVSDLRAVGDVLRKAVAGRGPVIVEIDMQSVGGFAKQFAGPPVRKLEVVRD
jgi:acetolactate synthase-1/2/3 large subunit